MEPGDTCSPDPILFHRGFSGFTDLPCGDFSNLQVHNLEIHRILTLFFLTCVVRTFMREMTKMKTQNNTRGNLQVELKQ